VGEGTLRLGKGAFGQVAFPGEVTGTPVPVSTAFPDDPATETLTCCHSGLGMLFGGVAVLQPWCNLVSEMGTFI
jgi:hypothetical protein